MVPRFGPGFFVSPTPGETRNPARVTKIVAFILILDIVAQLTIISSVSFVYTDEAGVVKLVDALDSKSSEA